METEERSDTVGLWMKKIEEYRMDLLCDQITHSLLRDQMETDSWLCGHTEEAYGEQNAQAETAMLAHVS